MSSTHPFDPDYVIPPGATLLETIEELGLTQKALAERMGRPIKTINEIVKGIAAITAETALQLERVTGVPAEFWTRAEANYRERLARLKEQEALLKQTEWTRQFSYTKMAKLQLVPETQDKVERVDNLLSFFAVASEVEWEDTYSRLDGAARESATCKSELGDLSAWLRAGEILSQRRSCAAFDRSAFLGGLRKIRGLTRTSPPDVWGVVEELCADAGVAVVLVPELPNTHVSGFTRWLSPTKALIQLSLRYKTDDMLWFTFFHEAAHILLHGKRDVFLEFRGSGDGKEAEADRWASSLLIPEREWQYFLATLERPVTKNKISAFAEQQGIAPGIVLGRLQHRARKVRPQTHNDLKRKVEISWQGL